MSTLDVNDLAKVSVLFDALDTAAREDLMARAERRTLSAGAVLCREGEPADVLYALVEGRARVSAMDFGVDKDVGALEAGQVFGEQALLSGTPRQATVTAMTALEVLAFPRAVVDAVLAKNPSAKGVLSLVGELRADANASTLAR